MKKIFSSTVIAALIVVISPLHLHAAPKPRPGTDTFVDPIVPFQQQVRALLVKEDFKALDRMEDELLKSRARFKGGEWKLYRFYGAISQPGAGRADLSDRSRAGEFSDEVWEAHIARLARWRTANPESRASVIALGDAWMTYGWKARGNGESNTVTTEGRRLFKDRLAWAESILTSGTTAQQDPQWYCNMIDVG